MDIARIARPLAFPTAVFLCLAAWGCSKSGEEQTSTDTTAQTQGNPKEFAPVKFTQVATLLNNNCMPCHSARNKKGKVDLSSYEGAVQAIKIGDPDNSEMILHVRGTKTPRMPMNKPPLSADDEALLVNWVKGGAEQ